MLFRSEQLEDLAKFGPNLDKAGTGVRNLAEGLTSFSTIDSEKIKAIAALPTEKIAAMGVAMSNANAVYNQSGANAGAAGTPVEAGTQNAIIAPTTNNTTTNNQVVQLPVRNQEQTMQRYVKMRHA